MRTIWFLTLLFLSIGGFLGGHCKNVSSRPAVVRIGALFAFNSTIGRAAKFAIKEAVKDVNSNSSILQGTELTVTMQNSNCNGFIDMVEALRFMETDIVAIIGPQCSTVAHLISIIANELKVPLLSFAATDPTLTSLDMPFFVRTTLNDLYQMDAIAEIVDYYGWKSVIAIYVDDDYGRNGVSALSDKLEQRRCRISYKLGIPPRSVVTRSDIMDLLVKVALMESRIIILHVGPDMGLLVFSVAHYLGMMDNGYVWIATDWLTNILDSNPFLPHETMDTLQGVLALRQYSPDSDKKIAFLSRWRDLSSSSFGMSSYGFNAYDSVWILAHAIDAFLYQGGIISFSNDSKLQAMDGGNLHLDAMTVFDDGKLLLDKILETDIIGLSGHLKFTPDRSLIHPAYDIINVIGTGYHRIGYWSDHSGLSTVPPETLYTRSLDRSNGSLRQYSVIWPGETISKPRGWVFSNQGKLLKIGVPRRVSFKEFVTQVNQTNTFEGFCIDVFKAAVDLLPYPLPYEFIPFGDGCHNPSYTELVKLILTGVIDAAVGDIAIVTNRTKMVDFTQPYAASRLVVVAPFGKMDNGALSFLQPFSPCMWIVTAFFSLFVGIVVWTLEHRINNEFRGPPRKQVTTVLFFSFSRIIFTPREKIISVLGRTVMIVSFFVVFINNKTYSANLASILTVQKLSSHVKGIQSLIKSDEPIGYQTGSFAEYYLSQTLNISKSRLVSLNSPEEYAAALTNGPDKGGVMAVVDELPYIELFLSDHCSFRISGEDYTKISWGFAFPRDSPLAIDLSTAILKLTENGYLERTRDKWLTKDMCDTENTELESYQLHLRSFCGLFLIYGIACVVALFIYITCTARKLQRNF